MSRILITCTLTVLVVSGSVFAGADPILARQQSMENTRDAAKVIGGMLKGQQAFEAAAAMQAFDAWKTTAAEVGELFPAGSETGHDTEAKATIWSDREGFERELQDFADKVDAAIEANPGSLEELKAAAGPVFNSCKSCHEGYRVDKED